MKKEQVSCLASMIMLAGAAQPLAVGTTLSGFTVKSITDLPEVKGRLVRMTYGKNGADLAWLDRDDDNMTFGIAFRTIPEDDTGVAHILEHSVLCGSDKYPVKEPFVELLKSSFSTYLNAWTAADCTMYPVCSRNGADFLNLMDVYLDAVFHPLSVKGPLPFRQEGWHYEISKDGELTRNGVVLSEMKGAFASPKRLAYHETMRMLFPDNCYRFVSGGDPKAIHNLTFEAYKAFYARHYHPSNARIFLDGRIDLPAVLARLDEFLSPYDRADVATAVPRQWPVKAQKTVEYELGEDDTAENKTILEDGWVIGAFNDRETCLAFDVLADVLAGSNEDPLAKALLDRGLCEDVRLGAEGSEQQTAMLVLMHVADGKADEARRTVRDTLTALAANGLDRDRLNAVIDRHEFDSREKDYGGFPRGLAFFSDALDQWLYGGDPADAFRNDALYASLREKVATGWFEKFLRKTLLDNPHHVRLTLRPSKTLGAKNRAAEKAELAAIKAKWTPEELARVTAEAKALEDHQKRADDPADLAKLPVLALKDIPEIGPAPSFAETAVGGTRVLRAKTTANGIAYAELYFSLEGRVSPDDLSDAAVLADVLGELPTAKRSALSLKNALDAGLGRFDSGVSAYAKKPGDPSAAAPYFVVRVSALDTKLDEIVRLVPEVLLETKFTDVKQIGDLLKQRRRALERGTAGLSGRVYAARRAAASQSVRGAMEELYAGLAHLRRLQKTDDAFATDGAAYGRTLGDLARRIFTRGAVTVCLSDNVPTDWLEPMLAKFPAEAAAATATIAPFPAKREGFRTAGNVGAAAKASFPGAGRDAFTGPAAVAARILSLGYLWDEIRVRGGAYGGHLRLRAEGDFGYLSWNDPTPARSLGVYDKSGDALRQVASGAEPVDKYIISAVAATEPYQTPSVETTRVAEMVLSGRSADDVHRFRREMLRTTKADLAAFADVLDAVTNTPSVCVIGGAAQVDGCKDALDTVEAVAGE